MANILDKFKGLFSTGREHVEAQTDGISNGTGPGVNGTVSPRKKEGAAIGRREIEQANSLLMDYKNAKARLDGKITENEEWFRLRHWGLIDYSRSRAQTVPLGGKDRKPVSGYLLNSMRNKHADAMDNYPRANVLPRREDDRMEATRLSVILPMILEHAGFEQVYSDVQWYREKQGTGVYTVYWDKEASGGVGDIGIKKVDLLNLFWEPGVTDIQDSPDLFYVRMMNAAAVEREHPELKGKLREGDSIVSEYADQPERTMKSRVPVVDWYYKVKKDGRTVVHLAQYVGEHLIYATENDEALKDRGLYDHGKYPFVFDVYLPLEGQPVGFGEIDVGKSKQECIDVLWDKIIKNTDETAQVRYFVPRSSKVNEQEFSDLTKRVIHYEGTETGILPVNTNPIHGNILSVMEMLVDELKETTGARDVAMGGTTSGVTAASGIAAMQEASGKTSRDTNAGAFRAFREVVEMVIELIRQFYDAPHYFRVFGDGYETYIRYTNEGLKAQGEDARMPLFDLEITTEKNSTYSRIAQNTLALELYNAGMFNANNADAALACIDMMEFDQKEAVVGKIRDMNTKQQLMNSMVQIALLLAQEVDRMNAERGMESNYTETIQAQATMLSGEASGAVPGAASVANVEQVSDGDIGGESTMMQNAREQAATASSPV